MPQSGIAPNVLRMTDDLRVYLMNRGDVTAVVSFAGLAIGPLDEIFRNGFPKFRSMPSSQVPSAFQKGMSTGVELGGNLWYLFLAGTAPGRWSASMRIRRMSPARVFACSLRTTPTGG